MNLAELTAGIGGELLQGDPSTEITGLALDSRKVQPGTLFFCVPGEKHDGHDFAPDAVEAGAAALVVEGLLDLPVPQVDVHSVRIAMAPIAARFYGDPSEELDVIAITGTNGKSTTAWMLRQILAEVRGSCGLIGTITSVVGGREIPVSHTTPEAIDLQASLRQMLDAGDRAAVIEASSHALDMHRCHATRYAAAVFTNLTQDHLDYHGTMQNYFEAKRLLFEMAPTVGVINDDDPKTDALMTSFGGLTYSAEGRADSNFRAEQIEFDAAGTSFELHYDFSTTQLKALPAKGRHTVRFGMPGRFNVANALAAITAARRIGVPVADAVAALAKATPVPGRFEPVDRGQDFTVLVDYAHTPDSLENVLVAARELTRGRLIAVFGAGGDRDRDKRPKMGRTGAGLADLAVITSDNPRSEDPATIVAEVASGAQPADGAAVRTEVDRRRAIEIAIAEAGPGDVVVIAGKGHEQGQEFADGHKIPFDDRQVAAAVLAGESTESPPL